MTVPIDPEFLLRENAWLRRLARSLAADPASADDLVQDTWVTALEHPARAFGDGARAWLVSVARNLVRAGGRRRANESTRERAVARHEALPSVSESVDRVAAQRELVDAVLALEPLDRDLVVLRYFEGLPPRAISSRLGLSGPAVRSRLSRALARLRERLDRRFEGGRAAWAALLVPGGSELRPTIATSLPFWLAALGTGAATLVVTVRALAPSSEPEASAAPLLAAAEPAPAPAGLEPSARQEPPPVAASSAPRVASERAPTAQSAAAVVSGLTLVARFVDENGAPLAGVRLAHSHRGDEWFGESVGESDRAGELRIELSWPYTGHAVGKGQDWVWLKASGRAVATRDWTVKLNGPGEQSLGEIRMVPGGSIVGRTVDEDGRPVEGAFVSLTGGYAPETAAALEEARTLGKNVRPGPNDRIYARTGADGRFELDGVPATDVAVHAVTAGFLRGFSELTRIAPGSRVDAGEVVLARPGPENLITGTVRDAQGTPVAQVRIEYGEHDPLRSEGSWHGATDASGRFALQVPRERKYTLLFSRDEKGRDPLVLADVSAGTLDLDVRLPGERWIEIVALDEEQEIAPIRALQVWGPDGVGLPATSEALPDGRQRLRVPSAPFRIQIFTPGWKNQKQGTFDPSTVADRLVFPVQRSAEMSGSVRADGVPVAGARVHGHEHLDGNCGTSADGFHACPVPIPFAQTETDAEGRFSILCDSSGTVTLHAELDGWARAELAAFEFVDGVEQTGLDLVLQRGGTIEGRILVAEGVEVRGKIVGVGCGDGHVFTQEVGADGAYCFEHLRPGDYQVLSVSPSYVGQLQRGSHYRWADPAEIPVVWNATVRAGEVTHLDLDLRDLVPSRLTGELRFDGQASVSWGCELSMSPPGGGFGHDNYARDSLAGGRFDLRVPRPGPFSLTLWSTAGPAEVRLHQTLELAPGDNSWHRDLSTATLTLEHIPAFDQEDTAYCLRWRDDPELTWTAWLHEPPANDARLTIPLVPAGHVQVLRRPEEESYGPDESWPVVLELDLTAGTHATIAFP